MEQLSVKDLPYIKITDFMAAIGREPVRKDGKLRVYDAPYNCADLYRSYGIETKDMPTCVVDTVSNSWYDSQYKSYGLSGNLFHLVGTMFDSYDRDLESRYMLDVMNDYIRKNTIQLCPIPRVRFEQQGNILCMVFTPQEISFKEFLIEDGYKATKTEGNLTYYSYDGRWSKDNHPDVVIDNQKGLWVDQHSGKNMGIADLISIIIGEDSYSDILWYIAEVMEGKEVIKEIGPEGMKIEPVKQKLDALSLEQAPSCSKPKIRL
ncbi:hypothetical protein [uncultured Duncaniella sp.]|uniref:hypothetical protein n=1 Tax=uncultured Duncaniella sp. TaxID=2768039 RepID=UPI00260FB12A|nr:hypothetical protein [uncultured Duncaniella sp.]